MSRSQDANQASIELRQLENSADSYRAMLKSAFQRNTELVQQQSFPGTEARMITRAATPTSQSSPKTLVILLVSASGGMMLGLAFGILRATLERVFRTSGQVEAALQANCIALVPLLKPGKTINRPANSALRTISEAKVVWEVVDRPLSGSPKPCARSSPPPT